MSKKVLSSDYYVLAHGPYTTESVCTGPFSTKDASSEVEKLRNRSGFSACMNYKVTRYLLNGKIFKFNTYEFCYEFERDFDEDDANYYAFIESLGNDQKWILDYITNRDQFLKWCKLDKENFILIIEKDKRIYALEIYDKLKNILSSKKSSFLKNSPPE